MKSTREHLDALQNSAVIGSDYEMAAKLLAFSLMLQKVYVSSPNSL